MGDFTVNYSTAFLQSVNLPWPLKMTWNINLKTF
jgi:hypothetical protein